MGKSRVASGSENGKGTVESEDSLVGCVYNPTQHDSQPLKKYCPDERE